MHTEPYDVEYDPAVDLEEAVYLAHDLEMRVFDSEEDRFKHIMGYPETETPDDYLVITAIVDSCSETSLTAEEVIDAETREELITLLIEAHMEQLCIDELFAAHDATTLNSPMMEFQVSETPPLGVHSEGDAFSPEEMVFETVTAKRQKLAMQTQIGLGRIERSVTDAIKNWVDLKSTEIHDVLPEPITTDGVPIDVVLDGMAGVEEAAYNPNTIIVGEDVPLPESEIYGIDVDESPYIDPNEIIVGDGDRLGYEVQFNPPYLEILTDITAGNPDQFKPMLIELRESTNWVTTQETAVTRIQLESTSDEEEDTFERVPWTRED